MSNYFLLIEIEKKLLKIRDENLAKLEKPDLPSIQFDKPYGHTLFQVEQLNFKFNKLLFCILFFCITASITCFTSALQIRIPAFFLSVVFIAAMHAHWLHYSHYKETPVILEAYVDGVWFN